jgi:hypothetical protein
MQHIACSVSSIGASAMAELSLLIASPTSATANDGTPATPVVWVMESSEVVGGPAVVTVGSDSCNLQLGPISFSTYAPPGGREKPWAEQRLHAHSRENGRYSGPGTHQLSATTGDLCNWQTDLYRGTGQSDSPHLQHLRGLNVGWDLAEGKASDGPTLAQPVSGPGIPGPMPEGPARVQLFGGRIVPQPASAGHRVFDSQTAGTDERTAASLRPAPVIEHTWSNTSLAASSSTLNWLSAAVVLA